MSNYQTTFLNSRIISPLQHFAHQERSGGIVLAVAVLLALLAANSPWRESFFHFFEQHLGLLVNDVPFFNFTLEHWINDGLMSLFFFVVGLELKREFIGGELRELRKVTLPIGAAVLGMLVPALIYLAFNTGTPAADGWGIPMATDIAFALAVVYALGDRVPLSGKVFLATLAIVDDLGAVLIIALFYTSNISLINVVMGLGFLTLLYAANRLGVKSVWFYGIVGIGGVWVSFLLSGVHATIAAVLIAFTIPADSTIPEATFITRLKQLGQRFRAIEPNEVRVLEPEQVDILARIKEEALRATPPLQRLERNLHPIVSFVVLPIFALANAGIAFIDMDMATLFSTHIGLGVALGLLVGKPLGVALAVWVLMRLRWGSLSPALSWHHIWAIGCLAGIGFTMSMFVTVLAFTDPIDITQAKLGIFIASLISGIIGYLLLWRGSKAKKAFEA